MYRRVGLLRAEVVLIWACFALQSAKATFAPYLDQAFFFDYNLAGQPLPIPVTEQCQTIHVEWARSAATGPNPVAPYYLQVYTSAYQTPFVIPAGGGLSLDWAVPFNPDTLYQICMFDSNGNTGGCQGIYTVIPSSNTTCANVTAPAPLGINATVYNGPISDYGWIPQCTDVSVTPTNGTPPYTLTIASTLHPPWNITSNSTKPINWTVALSWASPFFISVVDSTGLMWGAGPLHSGESVNTSDPPTCLSQLSASVATKPPPKTVSLPATIGSAIGGLALGLILGLGAMFCCTRRKISETISEYPSLGKSYPATQGVTSEYRAVPSTSAVNRTVASASAPGSTLINRMGTGDGYTIEPFHLPTEDGVMRSPSDAARSGSAAPSIINAQSEPDSQAGESQAGRSGTQDRSHVYVVHHDAGRAPVTVYTPDGTEVVELPPRYADGRPVERAGSSSRGLNLTVHQNRSAAATPSKSNLSTPRTLDPPE